MANDPRPSPLEVAPLVHADEKRLIVAGDWHSNTLYIGRAIPAIAREPTGVKTILHVGDFGIWRDPRGRKFLDAVDFWCERAGISRVLVTPGNHEDWGWLDSEFSSHPGKPVPLSTVVQVLPRGYRFETGKRTFVSFGGAASVDFERRKEGVDWFPSELPTEADVARAVAGGHADVLLTHETIDGGTPASEGMLRNNPLGFSRKALSYSRRSRELVTRVADDIVPKLLFHGHMHVADDITLPSGQQVVSLGRDDRPRNMVLLELSDLSWRWLENAKKPPRIRQTRDWEAQFMTRPEGENIDN